MGFWKKKQPTRLTSDEYEEINKKIVAIIRDIDIANNRMEIFNSNWRKLSAKVAILNKEMSREEGEKVIKSEKVYM